MTSGNFRVNVLLRIVFIGLLIWLAAHVIYKTAWIITPVVIFIAIIIAIAELLRYAEKTTSEFSDFLLSIKSSDFSKYNTTDRRGKSFSQFKEAFNIIIEEFQNARIDKEAHYTFLKTVVENLNTAIISFDNTGEIKLINEAAKSLLHTPFLNNINYLQKIDTKLYNHLLAGNNEVLEISIQGQYLKLLVRFTDFRIHGTDHKLILIQNIKSEIERTEVEAWEQLLHVLTHEIMNSITPISSLSGTIKKRMDELVVDKNTDEDELQDMSEGLQVIENRSMGLINFVNNYKSLITLPAPDLKPVNVVSFFDKLRILTQTSLEEKGIELNVNVKAIDLTISMDVGLMEQVMLNLIYNAADAMDGIEGACIDLSAELQNGSALLKITDNGPGIDGDILGKIFVPFFTTKKKGTGIGLSLSKQIMRLHNGSINVQSMIGKGSIFILEFPHAIKF